MSNPMVHYALVANGEVDQICYSEHDARREAKDLKEMDIDNIRIYSVTGEQAESAIDEINEIFRDMKPFGRKGFRRLGEKYGVEINIIFQANTGRY